MRLLTQSGYGINNNSVLNSNSWLFLSIFRLEELSQIWKETTHIYSLIGIDKTKAKQFISTNSTVKLGCSVSKLENWIIAEMLNQWKSKKKIEFFIFCKTRLQRQVRKALSISSLQNNNLVPISLMHKTTCKHNKN